MTSVGPTPIPLSKEIEGAIIETALSLEDPRTRQTFLERTFQDDAQGLNRVKGLVQAAREASTFFLEARDRRTAMANDLLKEFDFDGIEPEAPLPQEGVGTRIDRYRLIQRIGEGGCGVVYEAEQEEPFRRRVALKVIRLGMDTEGVIARFGVERQALALMSHPNIARVLDAGSTSTGRPYFVMELVAGERITTYSDLKKLDTRERLLLFLQVCHAIQHAHQKGIIHRDIKPSNILVTIHDNQAVPKVIDFGIAKARGGRLTGQTMYTVADQLLGTPAYMSPEQVDMGGLDVDTRSDVYSLGVLLYEILTGRTPFDSDELAKASISEMRKTLLEREPLLPSQQLKAIAGQELTEVANRRRAEAPRLVSQLRGDLDWIVMKAMEKDRNRRYQTVNSLAMDVKRYLANEPVSARRPSRLYLMRKFARRNRVACASAAAVALSLIIGLGTSTRLYLRERKAVEEKVRLAGETESARAQEARLRRQAQARANVSRVAVLLSEGRTEDADALLHENPLESIEPSREAADVFRSLGDWNAICGRWPQAVECFTLLNQANLLDDPNRILEGSDLIASAPAFLENGSLPAFHDFRAAALQRYLPVQSALQAEHLLKAGLLAPADENTVNALRDTARLCEDAFLGAAGKSSFPAWEAFSVTLFRYRDGDLKGTIEWANKCIGHKSVRPGCAACALAIQAMALYQSGDTEAAGKKLEESRALILRAEQSPSDPKLNVRVFWYDWATARVLLREAEAVMR